MALYPFGMSEGEDAERKLRRKFREFETSFDATEELEKAKRLINKAATKKAESVSSERKEISEFSAWDEERSKIYAERSPSADINLPTKFIIVYSRVLPEFFTPECRSCVRAFDSRFWEEFNKLRIEKEITEADVVKFREEMKKNLKEIGF